MSAVDADVQYGRTIEEEGTEYGSMRSRETAPKRSLRPSPLAFIARVTRISFSLRSRERWFYSELTTQNSIRKSCAALFSTHEYQGRSSCRLTMVSECCPHLGSLLGRGEGLPLKEHHGRDEKAISISDGSVSFLARSRGRWTECPLKPAKADCWRSSADLQPGWAEVPQLQLLQHLLQWAEPP
jgi:hypothetical protein